MGAIPVLKRNAEISIARGLDHIHVRRRDAELPPVARGIAEGSERDKRDRCSSVVKAGRTFNVSVCRLSWFMNMVALYCFINSRTRSIEAIDFALSTLSAGTMSCSEIALRDAQRRLERTTYPILAR